MSGARLTVFSAALALWVGGTARAQVGYITQNTTIDGSSPFNSPFLTDLFVGRDASGNVRTSPTVSIINGGNPPHVNALNQSIVNMTGGAIRGALNAFDESTVTMSGGTAIGLTARDQGTVNFAGGTLTSELAANALGTINMSAGVVQGNFATFEFANATLTGGEVRFSALISGDVARFSDASIGQDVAADKSSTLFLNGMSVGRDVTVGESATLALAQDTTIARNLLISSAGKTHEVVGGSVGGNVILLNGGTLSLAGASVQGDASASGTFDNLATLNVTGGDLGSLTALNKSTVVLDGGTVRGELSAIGGPDLATATMRSGEVAAVAAKSFSDVALVSGTVGGDVTTSNNAKLTLTGDTVVGGALKAAGTSRVTMSGGTVTLDSTIGGTSQFTMTGGRFKGDLTASGTAPSGGGSIQYNATLQGGTIEGSYNATGNSRSLLQGVTIDHDLSYLAPVTVEGGLIKGDVNGSALTSLLFFDGTVIGGVNLNNDASFGMAAGTVGAVNVASEFSTFQMEDGTVLGGLTATAGELVMIDGEVKGDVQANGGTFYAAGGRVGGKITASGPANSLGFSARLDDANVTGDVIATGHATVDVKGGTLGRDLKVEATGTADLEGGTVNGLVQVTDAGTFRMSGGEVAGLVTGAGDAHVQTIGGTIGGGIALKDRATAELFGGMVNGGTLFALSAADFSVVNVRGTVITGLVQADGVGELHLSSGGVNGEVKLNGAASATVAAGFEITQDITAFDNAVVTIDGGLVRGRVHTLGQESRVSINGGVVGNGLLASGTSQTSIAGGIVVNGVTTFDRAVLTISGGELRSSDDLLSGSATMARDNSHLFIAGGLIDMPVRATESGTITMTAGEIAGGFLFKNHVEARDNGRVVVIGGEIEDNLEAHGSGQVMLGGGTVFESLFGDGNSVVTMTGGQVFQFAVFRGHSTFHFYGGTIGRGIINQGLIDQDFSPDVFAFTGAAAADGIVGDALFAYDAAVLNLYGTGLAATLIDPDYAYDGRSFSAYELSGLLADGTALGGGAVFYVENGSGADYRLLPVPEPGGAAGLIAAAAGSLTRRRVRRRCASPA